MTVMQEYWQQLLAGVALVVWAIRVEAKTKSNAQEVARLWTQRKEDQDTHRESRNATNEMLKEVRADIKELLRQNARE
ncbi:hypothetical protein JJB09_26450 [Rhizobium sp. KVB221]|uniref:Uncharacterized protein n=1 Tax=Rhizobium setariae TaxID=2801340 RepID=A0A936YV70_9HYPH|nr:hypothetical protein [Rhizobium setariae]MBL0375544.1 hypothetical protein [Rhizobium setariae]